MDRQAITRHLLSDAQDPYNRKPLTVEMLEPNDSLREEIKDWIRQAVVFLFDVFIICALFGCFLSAIWEVERALEKGADVRAAAVERARRCCLCTAARRAWGVR